MTYAVLGYAMIALIVILLLTNKANPIMAFIIVPPIIALTAGYSISEINDFIKAGVSSSMEQHFLPCFPLYSSAL